jgi:TonB family protein
LSGANKMIGLVMLALVVCSGVLASQSPQSAASATPAEAKANAVPKLAAPVLPAYPDEARAARQQGVVVVDASLGANGAVTDAKVTRSIPGLDQAVLDAVRQWRFEMAAGVRTSVTVNARFVLTERHGARGTAMWMRSSFIPDDLAFVYEAQCKGGSTLIDSTSATIVETIDSNATTRMLQLSSQDWNALYLKFFSGGFFSTPLGVTWREAAAGIAAAPEGVDVTVVAEAPQAEVVQSEAKRRPARYLHRLDVRQFGQWKRVIWEEPVDKQHADTQEVSTLGAAIRDVVARAGRQTTPPQPSACLPSAD